MQRGDHTAILSPPFFGIKINHCVSEFIFHSWEGILSGRFDGLRGASDLRQVPYIEPKKVYFKRN